MSAGLRDRVDVAAISHGALTGCLTALFVGAGVLILRRTLPDAREFGAYFAVVAISTLVGIVLVARAARRRSPTHPRTTTPPRGNFPVVSLTRRPWLPRSSAPSTREPPRRGSSCTASSATVDSTPSRRTRWSTSRSTPSPGACPPAPLPFFPTRLARRFSPDRPRTRRRPLPLPTVPPQLVRARPR